MESKKLKEKGKTNKEVEKNKTKKKISKIKTGRDSKLVHIFPSRLGAGVWRWPRGPPDFSV
jgi:hypothetical protein